jgi:hypothetical protein
MIGRCSHVGKQYDQSSFEWRRVCSLEIYVVFLPQSYDNTFNEEGMRLEKILIFFGCIECTIIVQNIDIII